MKEKVLTAGLLKKGEDINTLQVSLSELEGLVKTAGGEVFASVTQRRDAPDPAYYIGRGKTAEIADICDAENIRTVVFDDELSPAQTKNLESAIDAKVIDRTRLILDIFAKRAKTKEGILQVELAQLEYMLPRLSGKGKTFMQQTGGIGTIRGPGEKKLEMEQRRIREHITVLKGEINKIKLHRDLQREKRYSVPLPIITIVGYTNAGKSTLFNYLINNYSKGIEHKNIYVDDKLFATLDPTTKRIKLPKSSQSLFVDTVGFISKLPHDLVAAFRATLEEALNADIILNVIDSSSEYKDMQIETVYNVINDLYAQQHKGEKIDKINIPVINVYNKYDKLDEKDKTYLKNNEEFVISAKTGFGVERLLNHIETVLTSSLSNAKLYVPYSRGDIISKIKRTGRIVSERNLKKYMLLTVKMDSKNLGRIMKMLETEA